MGENYCNKFKSVSSWNIPLEQAATLEEDESDFDEENHVVRGTRSLEDIYNMCNVAMHERTVVSDVLKSPEWKVAIEEEINMINKNDTWILVDRPYGRHVIGVTWVFMLKLNSDGSINKHKVRLVDKVYSQQYRIDLTRTFAPVARFDTIRLLFVLAAQKGWLMFHFDVKSTFLNGTLKEEIYVEQPEGVTNHEGVNKVYLLKKVL